MRKGKSLLNAQLSLISLQHFHVSLRRVVVLSVLVRTVFSGFVTVLSCHIINTNRYRLCRQWHVRNFNMLLCNVAVLKTQFGNILFIYINFQFPRPELRILLFFFFFFLDRLVVGLVYYCLLECCIDMSPLFSNRQCFFSPDLGNLHKPFNRIITEYVLKFNVLECL